MIHLGTLIRARWQWLNHWLSSARRSCCTAEIRLERIARQCRRRRALDSLKSRRSNHR